MKAVRALFDCLLEHLSVSPVPTKENGYKVTSVVTIADESSHKSDGGESEDANGNDCWSGLKEEKKVMGNDADLQLGLPPGAYMLSQGLHYCPSGAVDTHSRRRVSDHAHTCLGAGRHIKILGEVLSSDESKIRVAGKGNCSAGDQLDDTSSILRSLTSDGGNQIEKHGIAS